LRFSQESEALIVRVNDRLRQDPALGPEPSTRTRSLD
jgi:hypothetical protein